VYKVEEFGNLFGGVGRIKFVIHDLNLQIVLFFKLFEVYNRFVVLSRGIDGAKEGKKGNDQKAAQWCPGPYVPTARVISRANNVTPPLLSPGEKSGGRG
jgi:hypothetical protein